MFNDFFKGQEVHSQTNKNLWVDSNWRCYPQGNYEIKMDEETYTKKK